MKKSVLFIQCILVVILVAGSAGCAAAGSTGVSVTKANGAAYDHSKQIIGTNTATVSKEIGFTVTGNGGKFAYTASGPVSATSLDGNVTVFVDAMELAISGKTSGTGTATANATILATGTATPTGSNVLAVIDSDIAVTVGKSGSAEATASASGYARSNAGSNVGVNAWSSGSTTATGKVSSPYAYALAEGEIVGVADYGYVNGAYVVDPFCEVESGVEGSGTSTARATSVGRTGALVNIPREGYWSNIANGDTAARGTSKNTGYYDVEAGIETLADYDPENVASTIIHADAFTSGNDNSAIASGTATVKSSDAGAWAEDRNNHLSALIMGNATGTSSIQGYGKALGEGRICSESSEYGTFYWYGDFEQMGYLLNVNGHLMDDSYLEGTAQISGNSNYFSGSASGSSDGSARTSSYIFDPSQLPYTGGTSSTSVMGAAASSATAKKYGWTEADAGIVSVDALDAKVNLLIHSEGIEQIDEQLPADIGDYGFQQIGTSFYAPAFEASAIQQVSATGGSTAKDSAEARAVATGTAESHGIFYEQVGPSSTSWTSGSYATGITSGYSRANMCTDPTSTSLIAEFSTWTGEESAADIAIVGSASYADGACGMTGGLAEGSAGSAAPPANIGFSAYAEGMAKTYAQANNAVSLALAGVSSGNYAGEGDGTILGADASLVDASLVGSATLSFGASGQAAAEAAGNASSSNNVITAGSTVSGGLSTIVGNGATESAVRVKNGIAVDAAAVTSIGLLQLGQSGDLLDNYATGVSGVVDISLADADGKNNVAEAAGMASGSTRTAGGFNVYDIENEVTQIGTFETSATGVVEDAVEAAFADPLAASAVASFVSINSEPDGIPNLVVDGSLVGSIAMAEGQSARAAGAAAGSTQSSGQLTLTDSSNEEMDVVTNLLSMTNASAVAATAAEARGGLALSIAGDGSINVVAGTPDPNYNVVVSTPDEPEVPLHAILLGDIVELTPEQHDQMVGKLCEETGMASEYLPAGLNDTADELLALIISLRDAEEPAATDGRVDPLIVDGSLTGAASFVVGNAEAESGIVGGTDTEGVYTVAEVTPDPITVTTVLQLQSNASAGGVVSTEVAATNGVALGAGGMGSLDVVAYEYGDEEAGVSPVADMIEVSLLGDVAFADSFDKKATSWAKVNVAGGTVSSGSFDDLTGEHGFSSSSAEGTTNGFARAYNCDPLSISLIGAITDVEADGAPDPVEFEVEDNTFITTVSIAAGEGCGLANGGAAGAAGAYSTNINGVASGSREQASNSRTSGAYTSAVDVKGGIGIAAAGAGAEGEVEWERPPYDRDATTEAGIYAYTGGEGFTGGSVVKTSSGFTDAYADVYADDHLGTDFSTLLYSSASVGGSGSSTGYVLGLNAAESLANAEAGAYASEDPQSTSIAGCAFGVQMLGSDAGTLTATATLTDVGVYGNAASHRPDETFATAYMWDGGATAILQPKVNTAAANAWNNQETLGASLNGGYVEGGFAAVDTINDPNTAYAFRYAGAQGQGGIPPVPVPDDFIVLW